MRIKTGLATLDKLISGGFPNKTIILLSGGPGTGKTLMGLNFLKEGTTNNEKCCYLSICENEEELIRACNGIEGLKKMENFLGKNFAIESLTLGEKIDLDYFTKMFTQYPETDRLVIDNINKLLMYAENKRDYRMKFAEILNYLKEKVKCSLILCESENGIDTGNGEAFECDGVISISFLELEEKPLRTLAIHKLRYTDFEPKIYHELIINKKGLKLNPAKII